MPTGQLGQRGREPEERLSKLTQRLTATLQRLQPARRYRPSHKRTPTTCLQGTIRRQTLSRQRYCEIAVPISHHLATPCMHTIQHSLRAVQKYMRHAHQLTAHRRSCKILQGIPQRSCSVCLQACMQAAHYQKHRYSQTAVYAEHDCAGCTPKQGS